MNELTVKDTLIVAKKAHQRQLQVPGPRTYNVRLSKDRYHPVRATFEPHATIFTTMLGNREFCCRFDFGHSRLDRRVYFYDEHGMRRVLRNEAGQPVMVPVPFPTVTATININGVLQAMNRAYCKFPDIMDKHTGMKMTLQRILKTRRESLNLQPEEYETLVKVCLSTPPKLGQIRRIEKMLSIEKAAK